MQGAVVSAGAPNAEEASAVVVDSDVPLGISRVRRRTYGRRLTMAERAGAGGVAEAHLGQPCRRLIHGSHKLQGPPLSTRFLDPRQVGRLVESKRPRSRSHEPIHRRHRATGSS